MEYSLQKFYALAFENNYCPRLLSWRSKCTPLVKLFSWLLYMDTPNTKNSWYDDEMIKWSLATTVPFSVRTLGHPFLLSAPFSESYCNHLGISWIFLLSFFDMIPVAAHSFQGPCFCRGISYYLPSWCNMTDCNIRSRIHEDFEVPTLLRVH